MKRPRLVLILAAAGLLAAAGAGYAWWHVSHRNALVAAALPPVPNLSGWNSEFRDRIASCERRAKHGPDRVAALEELSRLYHANGFFPEASRCYKGLLEVEPDNPVWAHRLAFILAQYGDFDHAIPLWKWVIEKAPQHIQAAIRLGDALLKDNHLEQAESAYRHALERDPGNPYAQLGLARIDMVRAKWSDARTRLEAAASSTDYAIGGNLLVTVYEHLGLTDQALALRGATKASGAFYDIPDAWLDDLYSDCYDTYHLIIYSGAADHSGDVPTALKIAERAIELNPDDGHAQFQAGMLYQRTNQPLKALTAMKKCIAVLPDFSDGWYQLYALEKDQGDTSTAIQTLLAGLRVCPKSPGLHLEYGNLLAQSGHADQAIAEYELVAALRPQEADAQLLLARLYSNQGRIDDAIAELKAALVAQPGHPAALVLLSMYSIAQGNQAEARHWIHQSSFQPRIPQKDRDEITSAFTQRFGHAP